MKLNKLRPSAAMIVACVALVAAIGGSAYAGSKINGNDIKRNTVTGKQVNESSLGTVPKAKNSRTVGGKKQMELKTRWFLLNEQGEIAEQSGGFTVIDAYETNSNAYIDTGESVEGKGLSATIAIQNQINGGNVNGEVSVARCEVPGAVACAPPGTQSVDNVVVSPRNSDGSASAAAGSGTSTKRVYVTVTE